MKFKHNLTSRATLKKKKEYDFPELTEEDIKEGMERSYENEYFVKRNHSVLGLYNKDGKLIITFYHSYDKFEELKFQTNQKF